MSKLVDPVEKHLAHLREALRRVLADAGLKPTLAGEKIGRSRPYVARWLSGQAPLKVKEVFELLLALEVSPEIFFFVHFPYARTPEQAEQLSKLAGRLPPWLQSVLGLPGADRAQVPHARFWDAEDWAEEIIRMMRALLQERQVQQREAADLLGLDGEALSPVLRGVRSLTFAHVFAVLAACEKEPERFFFEMAMPAGSTEQRMLRRDVLTLFAEHYQPRARTKRGDGKPKGTDEPPTE
jgi:transcriptional regulator with XRE-family HTH domain